MNSKVISNVSLNYTDVEPVETKVIPKVEEPKPQDNHLEELINSLKDEIAALKEMNGGLQEKIKGLEKEPSAKPISVQAKPSAGDTYSSWRESLQQLL